MWHKDENYDSSTEVGLTYRKPLKTTTLFNQDAAIRPIPEKDIACLVTYGYLSIYLLTNRIKFVSLMI